MIEETEERYKINPQESLIPNGKDIKKIKTSTHIKEGTNNELNSKKCTLGCIGSVFFGFFWIITIALLIHYRDLYLQLNKNFSIEVSTTQIEIKKKYELQFSQLKVTLIQEYEAKIIDIKNTYINVFEILLQEFNCSINVDLNESNPDFEDSINKSEPTKLDPKGDIPKTDGPNIISNATTPSDPRNPKAESNRTTPPSSGTNSGNSKDSGSSATNPGSGGGASPPGSRSPPRSNPGNSISPGSGGSGTGGGSILQKIIHSRINNPNKGGKNTNPPRPPRDAGNHIISPHLNDYLSPHFNYGSYYSCESLLLNLKHQLNLNCEIEKQSLIASLRKEYEQKILELKKLLADKPTISINETINNIFNNFIFNENFDFHKYFINAFLNFNFSYNFQFHTEIYESIKNIIIQPSFFPYFSLLSLNLFYQQNTNIKISETTINILQNSVNQIDFTNIKLTKEEIFYTLNYIIEHPSITRIKWGENKSFQDIEAYLFSIILPLTNIKSFDISQISISEEIKTKIFNKVYIKEEPINIPPKDDKTKISNQHFIINHPIVSQGKDKIEMINIFVYDKEYDFYNFHPYGNSTKYPNPIASWHTNNMNAECDLGKSFRVSTYCY